MSVKNLKELRVDGGIRVFSVCDPIYGLRAEAFTQQITTENWETKALWRKALTGFVYLYVDYNPDPAQSGDPLAYKVISYLYDLNGKQLEHYAVTCVDLESAVRYANGEGRSALALFTSPVEPDEYPAAQPARVFVSTPFGGGKS